MPAPFAFLYRKNSRNAKKSGLIRRRGTVSRREYEPLRGCDATGGRGSETVYGCQLGCRLTRMDLVLG